MEQEERKLAAIMFTDMVGYTSLSQKNERVALDLLEKQRNVLRKSFPKHRGKEIKTIGDGFLVEFGSALEATQCAFDVQQSLHELSAKNPAESHPQLRIGIHVGDVIRKQNDIYGDAVNVASRIEPLATPGGVCVTQQVHDHVKNKLEFPFARLGRKALKNISELVEVYRIVFPWERKDDTGDDVFDTRRIAVLPFVNLSPDPNDEFFADGLTEELIDRIGQVKNLEVIARTSAMSYRGKDKKADEIGRDLRVGALVEGSVRTVGSRVRVNAKLVNADTETQLWSSSYDRDLEDIFAVQNDIATKVAEELRIQLLDSEKIKLRRDSTGNTEAYMNFLKGRELLLDGSEQYVRQAMRLFERAIELDPSFARAYLGLAGCYQQLGNAGYSPWGESIEKSNVALRHSLELDPYLAEAHAAKSLTYLNEDNLADAEVEARKAIELNPSLPEAYDSLANVLAWKGESEETLKLIETCYRLDPIRSSFVRDLGMLYFYTGREEEALKHWEKTAHLAPAGTYAVIAEYHLSKGNYARAREFHHMVEKIQPKHPWVIWMSGFIAALDGDRTSAKEAIKQIEASGRGPIGLNETAFVYYGLHDFDSYFDYLNQALDQHALNVVYITWCPLFKEARHDERYRALQAKLRRTSSHS